MQRGGAGHSEYLLSKLGPNGHLMLLTKTRRLLIMHKLIKDYIEKGQVTFIKDNFRNLASNLAMHGVTGD